MSGNAQERCRLVLIGPAAPDWRRSAEQIADALDGGDVASLILWQGELCEADFQKLCEAVVPAAQSAGVAAIVAGDSRIAGRTGADGIHSDKRDELADLVEAHSGRLIIGAGGARTRHDALELGELRPDYVFFGRFGYDTKPEPHPRNLGLGGWWAEFVEIPCIVMAGSVIESIATVAATGAEFAAVSTAVFTGSTAPGEAVRRANALLDEKAPPLGEPA
ncbi:MAG: thiamine phosphate synthase [Rhizobiaceae bacterium]